MKKSKLIFSTFVLVMTLIVTSLPAKNVYADSTDPQGAVNSTKTPPPPPPPPPPSTGNGLVDAIWAAILAIIT